MTAEVRVTAPGNEIARICANAAAFVPAKAETQMLALRALAGRLEARGTDGYAAGVDSTEAGTTGIASVALARDDMALIETKARSVVKATVTLILTPAQVSLSAEGKSGELLTGSVPAAPYPVAWAALDRLMERDFSENRPEFVAFDPQLFGRVAKVKVPAPDRVMDLWFSDPEQPVLVKIGPTFRGLVMPLHRKRAEAYAPEGLW
jgi:hypothetical protein